MSALKKSLWTPLKTAEAKTVDFELTARGISHKEFAAQIGEAWPGYKKQRTASFPSDKLRAQIEAGLDYTVPIWSSRLELQLRKRILDARGYDPALLSREILAARASELGVPSRVQRAELVSAVLAKLAVNSMQTEPQ